jgi:hypothetical protein
MQPDISSILEYVYEHMLDAKTADDCRLILQRAIVYAREHNFDSLREEFGTL